MEASPATKDSFITFFAEQDLLCALSTCPGGDLSAWGWGMADEGKGEEGDEEKEKDIEKGMKSTCREIRVEVLEIVESESGRVLRDWVRPERAGYKGMHGVGIPGGEEEEHE